MLCPRCLLELGSRKTVLARHRKQCAFGAGTPWGVWQERLEWWIQREERAISDAYANAARVLFYRAMGLANVSFVGLLHKLLQDDLELTVSSHTQLSTVLQETPTSSLGPAEYERLRGHRATVHMLASRIEELKQMKTHLEKTQ